MIADPLATMPETVDGAGDPQVRALDDLFRYQERYLEDLGFDDPVGTLEETSNRRRVADLWRAREQRTFPNPGATHSLALLLYWEARASGRSGAQLPSPPDSTDRLWTGAHTRFAALCASDAFWIEWGVLAGRIEEARSGRLGAALADRLSRELETIAARLTEGGDHPAAARFEEHLALFRSELEAAGSLPALRILSGRGLSPAAIVAGPVLLAEVGMLEKVRQAIAPQRPDLLDLFDPHARIRRLVREERYGAALRAIERMEPAEREEAEVSALEEVALLRGAEEALRAGRIEDAVRHWERALRAGRPVGPIREQIASLVTQEASALRARGEHGAAIGLLERAGTLTEDPAITRLLGAALVARAGERLDGVQQGGRGPLEPGDRRKEVGLAIVDLERAVALQPEDRAANEALEKARGLLHALDAGDRMETGARGEGDAGEGIIPQAPATTGAGRPGAGHRPLFYVGAALWLGIALLVLVAYPLVLPPALGTTGLLVVLGVGAAWGLAHLGAFLFLRG